MNGVMNGVMNGKTKFLQEGEWLLGLDFASRAH